ncbi:hypothetical protein SeLEV6574_g05815 [Synchytrium endobioticum]|uniref:Uncharacterized protein n=1 Tax=Synchytrium endobioticum TaxID=286115 RepID=A0A507CS86_9FUNG|nr:hypothetical protein SeLEV6574_g05815 [Synchytrium endobioticum]
MSGSASPSQPGIPNGLDAHNAHAQKNPVPIPYTPPPPTSRPEVLQRSPTPPNVSPLGWEGDREKYDAALKERIKYAEQKWGPGSTRKVEGKMRPHRCAEHLKDVLEKMSSYPYYDIGYPFTNFIKCMWAKPGEEPPALMWTFSDVRDYNDSAIKTTMKTPWTGKESRPLHATDSKATRSDTTSDSYSAPTCPSK